jgi:hypothetical protein
VQALPDDRAISCTDDNKHNASMKKHESAYLKCHQQTLAFNVCKTEVNTTRVAIYIAIPNNMLHLTIEFANQALGKFFNVSVVSLEDIKSAKSCKTGGENQ